MPEKAGDIREKPENNSRNELLEAEKALSTTMSP